jgi:hypothetical protein
MLNIPKTQWDGVVPFPLLWPFFSPKIKEIYERRYRWVTFGVSQLRAALPSIEAIPLEEHLKEVLVLQTQAYQRVSASSSSAFEATQCSPVSVISRFQKGARDLR